jgi:hypothetical protein
MEPDPGDMSTVHTVAGAIRVYVHVTQTKVP